MRQGDGSRTARAVAVGRAIGVAGQRDDHVAALLPAPDRALVRAGRRLGRGRTRRTMGWRAHPALRMLAVDAAIEQAIADTDAAEVVVIGAGYDTRAWRLEALAGRVVIEIDHPATQAAKRERLPPVTEARADLVLAPADLAVDDLDDVLHAAGHDGQRPTVWLWEAVVPYLPAEAVDTTLEVLRDRSAPGSRLLVTSVTPEMFDPPQVTTALRAPARATLQVLGEPLLLAESDDDVAARLARHGWRHRSVSGARDWAADAGVTVSSPVLDERLHVADRIGPGQVGAV